VHTRIPPFKSSAIRLLQPTASAKLRDKYGRMAWVIPVRGPPLLSGTSGAHFSSTAGVAALVQLDHNVPVPVPLLVPATTTNTTTLVVANEAPPTTTTTTTTTTTSTPTPTLRWTAPTLANFWRFLLRLRQTSVLGPLAISFQPRLNAPLLRPTPEVDIFAVAVVETDAQVGTGMGARAGMDGEKSKGVQMEMEIEMGAEEKKRRRRRRWLRDRLAETDHIKVYHDAALALNFRQLLEAYRDDERVREWCSPRDQEHSSATASAAGGAGRAEDRSREGNDVKRGGKGGNRARDKNREKWKPFKGAKLLLVDELGEPFLIA
jgi:hypothetical protein